MDFKLFKDIITIHLDIPPTISRLNLDDIVIIGVLPTYSIAMRTGGGGGGQAVGKGFIADDNTITVDMRISHLLFPV